MAVRLRSRSPICCKILCPDENMLPQLDATDGLAQLPCVIIISLWEFNPMGRHTKLERFCGTQSDESKKINCQ